MYQCSKKERQTYPIRPHHGMCLAFLSETATALDLQPICRKCWSFLQKVADVCLTVKTDEICSACPNNSQGICEAAEKVKRYDNAVLAECGLKEGQKLAFPEFTEAVQKKKSLKREKERKSAAIASGTGSARNSRVGGVNKAALAEKYREPDIQSTLRNPVLCVLKIIYLTLAFLLSPRFLRIWL